MGLALLVGNFLKNHDISTRNGIGKRILFITKRNEDQFYEFRSSDYASTKRYIKYPERNRTSDTGFRKPIKPISAGFIGVPDYFFHVLIEAIIAFFPLAVFNVSNYVCNLVSNFKKVLLNSV
jgi:hypothetical protein